MAAGRLAAVSIDQHLAGRKVEGDLELVNVLMGKLDEGELAELFRRIEGSPRVSMPELPPARRKALRSVMACVRGTPSA